MNLSFVAAMRTRIRRCAAESRSGFTLIEMLIVILIIGIMAGIAIPPYYASVERGRSQEAIELMNALRGAQAHYLEKYGTYCYTVGFGCPGFEVVVGPLKYFNDPSGVTPAAGAGVPSWQMTLTRKIASPGYGAYTIKFDVEPGAATFTCTGTGNCQTFMPKPE